jgi:hypothetical protein
MTDPMAIPPMALRVALVCVSKIIDARFAIPEQPR